MSLILAKDMQRHSDLANLYHKRQPLPKTN